MDVSSPSNWVRIADLFKNDTAELKKLIHSESYTDEDTVKAIVKIFGAYKYVACPHTAIAWLALTEWQEKHDDVAGVFLSTAHPCKFPDVFPENISKAVQTPEQVKELQAKERKATPLNADFAAFKSYLLEHK
jgi:threonine synthase